MVTLKPSMAASTRGASWAKASAWDEADPRTWSKRKRCPFVPPPSTTRLSLSRRALTARSGGSPLRGGLTRHTTLMLPFSAWSSSRTTRRSLCSCSNSSRKASRSPATASSWAWSSTLSSLAMRMPWDLCSSTCARRRSRSACRPATSSLSLAISSSCSWLSPGLGGSTGGSSVSWAAPGEGSCEKPIPKRRSYFSSVDPISAWSSTSSWSMGSVTASFTTWRPRTEDLSRMSPPSRGCAA
mmetsp:Transcript_11047/g.30979  ORF Transcript_11047/g.30979 Transcript_11047/m.30979 type:complete len:241 (-) Transcript_11047:335-1057(-)